MYASSRKTTWTLLYTIQVFWFPQPNECVSEKFPQGDILLKGRHHMPLCVFNRKAEPWHNQHQRSRCVKCRSTKPYKRDRKSTRLNSSHSQISYAVFCLKKKKKK